MIFFLYWPKVSRTSSIMAFLISSPPCISKHSMLRGTFYFYFAMGLFTLQNGLSLKVAFFRNMMHFSHCSNNVPKTILKKRFWNCVLFIESADSNCTAVSKGGKIQNTKLRIVCSAIFGQWKWYQYFSENIGPLALDQPYFKFNLPYPTMYTWCRCQSPWKSHLSRRKALRTLQTRRARSLRSRPRACWASHKHAPRPNSRLQNRKKRCQ